MTKKSTNIVKGFGTAMAIGGAVALMSTAVGKSSMSTKRNIRKTAMKAAQTLENVLDGISNVMS